MAQSDSDIQAAEFDKLWNYSKPADTEQKFREIMPQVQALKDTDLELQLLTQIARCQGLQRQFEAADSTLDLVASRLEPTTPIAAIRYNLERGRVRNSSNAADKAIPYFERAWQDARAAAADFHAVDAAHMLGIASKGELANTWNLKAVEAAEASENERARRWLGALYNNIGWYYFEAEKYSTAEEWFVKTLDWYQTRSLKRGEGIARWSIAKCRRLLGGYTEALDLQQTLLAEYRADGRDDDGYVYEEIAENLLALERNDEAREYFKQAHALLSKDQWLQANESARLERLEQLSRADK